MSRHETGTQVDGDDPRIVCDCGEEFPARKPTTGPDHWESPDWIAHVREHRHLRYVETIKQVQDLVMKVNLDNPDAVALAMGRLMRLVNPS